MFAQLFNKSLTLTINDRTLKFDSTGDFEFALASRTEVPAAKISDFVRFTPQQLLDEASSVRQVERYFVETLSRSIQEPGSIGYLLREMDMKMFSQDHEWRTMMQELTRQERRFNDYKQLALVKYMQYLASRQDVLKGIYTHKVTSGVNPEPDADPMQQPEFRQTLIFDVSTPVVDSEQPNEAVAPSHLVRLPRGESTNLRATESRMIELVLSRHSFRLRTGSNPMLVDDEDSEYPLRPGRNVLGRHPDSDVMVDAAYRDVSRTHAIVDVRDNGDVIVTDLSSHGTFVDAHSAGRN
ncbi:MAG: hypothetical protein ACI8W7_004194 [Gammaproteobacteria bacterium]|jgi:hypothetical protein